MKGNSPSDRVFAALRERLSALEGCLGRLPEADRSQAAAALAAVNHSLGGLADTLGAEREEHRLSEEELAASAHRYRLLLDSVDVGVYRATPDVPGHFLHVNRRMAEMFGFSEAELMQVPAASLCQDAGEWARFAGRLHDGGVAKDDEVAFWRKDGSPLWASCSATPKFDDSGDILWIDGALKDITRRKQAERALEESRERFRKLKETFPGVIFMTGTAAPYRPVLLGGDVEGIFGYPAKDFLEGRVRFVDLVFPEDLGKVNAEVQKSLAAGKPYRVDLRFHTRGGGAVWIHEAGCGIGGEPGKPEYLSGCMLNITEEKRSQQRLADAQSRLEDLESILGRSPVAVLLIKVAEGYPVEFVSGNVRQFGSGPEDLTAGTASWTNLVHPDDLARTERELQAYAAEGRAEFVQNYRLRTADGEYRWVEDFTLARMGEDGRPDHYEVILHDVTERHEAWERARDYQRKLRALAARTALDEDRERRRIAEALHDHLGQNLALASSNLSAAKRQGDAEKRRAFLEKASKFVRTSLDQVRLRTFELSSPVLYEQGLEAGLEALVELMRRSHAMKMRFEDDGQPKPLSQEGQIALYQSARELLLNAVKHSRAQSATVRVRRNGRRVRVEVEDDGEGFAAGDFPGNAGQTRGFGLFSVRERMEYMGGSFELHSAPGQGTRAVLTLPLAGNGPEGANEGVEAVEEGDGEEDVGEVSAGWGS